VLQADPERRRLLLATRVALEPGSRSLAKLKERLGQPLTVLLAMSGLVLLIACANVANLLTARGLERRREIAIRMAMGARRGRVLRQMLVESLLLAALGSAAGLVAAYWAVDLLLHWMSGPSGSLAVEPRLNVAVLGFTAAVSVGAALLFGILPALRATRVEPAAEAKAGWAAPGGSFPRLARGLVAAQIALSLVLLAGAGLFVRTLRNLAAADLGYDRHAVLSARIDPHAAGYPEQRLHELYRRLVERARAAPGVVSASVSHFSPGAGFMMSSGFYVIGRAPRPGEDHGALNNTVSPGYFGTLGIPLAAGRDFDARDRRGSPAVAIVNQAFARKFFGNERAIGRRIGYGPTQSDPFEIVGVVQDVKFGSARRRFDPVVYRSVWQSTETLTSVDVRVRGDARAAASLVRQALAEVDQDLPVLEVRTLAEMVSRGLAAERLIARLTGCFGLLALALAGVGLYGVVSCGVVRRTRELGIRMALGADAGVVLRMVLREAALLTAAGLAVGLPLTLAATRLVRSMLFGLSPGDPLTLAAAGALLAAVAFAAALWPARRAARVDPLAALRYE
jgi:predicted permease